jgi:hypothetical protein
MSEELTLEKMVQIDQKMKAKLAELSAEEKRIKEERDTLRAAMLQKMQADGLTTATIKGVGTAYIYKAMFSNIADDSTFFSWVKEHDAFDALERRVKSTFVKTYMDEHNDAIPPGLNVFTELEVRVRKSSE